jgi:hypothetical protein
MEKNKFDEIAELTKHGKVDDEEKVKKILDAFYNKTSQAVRTSGRAAPIDGKYVKTSLEMLFTHKVDGKMDVFNRRLWRGIPRNQRPTYRDMESMFWHSYRELIMRPEGPLCEFLQEMNTMVKDGSGALPVQEARWLIKEAERWFADKAEVYEKAASEVKASAEILVADTRKGRGASTASAGANSNSMSAKKSNQFLIEFDADIETQIGQVINAIQMAGLPELLDENGQVIIFDSSTDPSLVGQYASSLMMLVQTMDNPEEQTQLLRIIGAMHKIRGNMYMTMDAAREKGQGQNKEQYVPKDFKTRMAEELGIIKPQKKEDEEMRRGF